ncbi:MAG TPA: glycoside hydrolase family 127 protein [Phycisphaerae bacterium]|nr:glycoside hydrolase family 127 protein [Phycisphaerae bacterium]HRR84144.1 glycoside hydrolase family 127 protein [Phycisphaerae bacterium]
MESRITFVAAAAVFMASMAVAGEMGIAKMKAVAPTQVKLTDSFWAPRLEINRTVTLPHNIKMCEETGRISNFDKAAGKMQGKYEGAYFNDSDVYKVLEGAAYILAAHPDKEMDARVVDIIARIAAAQQPDGYLNAYYTVMEPDKRWTDLPKMHELYCAGHLTEAAVAWADATGRTDFLDVARRFIHHIEGIFGFDKRHGVPGHEEIELALVKLYRKTGEERYLKLAEYFLAARGTKPEKGAEYRQDHIPIKQQKEIVGHAVRAMYLYSGVTDVAAITGDKEYLQTLDTIWHDVVTRKMYITGGVGARHEGEAFGGAYELPNDSAYAETCAGIGLAFWAHRMLMLHGESRFADVLERELYNAFPSSVSLKGDAFFYVNPLSSKGEHHRQPWYGCACCPTNIVRVMPQVPGYAYSQSDDGVWVNLYMAGEGTVALKSGEVKLAVDTKYPWEGKVKIKVTPREPAEFAINLRVPDWCEQVTVSLNGTAIPNPTMDKGYAVIRRQWKAGDAIEMDMAMPVRRIQAHPNVAANRGRVALQRGPMVFCLEAVDNGGKVFDLVLPRDAELKTEFRPNMLGGIMTIKAQGLRCPARDWKDKLYLAAPAHAEPVELTAVPYCIWDNREAGEMTVWIPEITGLSN